MLTEAVIVALITVGGSIVVQLIIAQQASKKNDIDRAVRQAKLDDQLNSISKRLDEHNGYAKKFGEIGDSIDKINLRMTEMSKDIEYLRKGTQI